MVHLKTLKLLLNKININIYNLVNSKYYYDNSKVIHQKLFHHVQKSARPNGLFLRKFPKNIVQPFYYEELLLEIFHRSIV
jgi:hypothetical protein